MAVTIGDQLRDWAHTLRIVSNMTGPVEPGQTVDLRIVSSALDPVTDQLLPVSLGQLLSDAPVRLRVRWEVESQDGPLKADTDYFATRESHDMGGLAGAAISLVFVPPIEPLTYDVPSLATVTIKPTVTLEVLLTTGTAVDHARDVFPHPAMGERNPLRLDLQLVPLQVPVFAALFRFDDFRPFGIDMEPGFSLIVVKGNSPILDVAELLNGALLAVEDAVRPLRAVASLAAFLAGLGPLRHALAAQPMTRVVSGDIANLEEIHMRRETTLGIDELNRDLRANDRVSSLILVGPPGTTIECFSDRDFGTQEPIVSPFGTFPVEKGAFTVVTDATLMRFIPKLADVMTGSTTAGVSVVEDDTTGSFDDSITSIRFA